jgi:hypothetical protein
MSFADLNSSPSPDTSASMSLSRNGEYLKPDSARWSAKTNADILDESQFETIKAREQLHVVGVTGFSGQWSNEKIGNDPALAKDYADAVKALEVHFTELKRIHGDKLVVSSGATMEGVPKIVYEVCERLGIAAMGVTSEKAFDYELGKMRYMIVHGRDWGEESPIFLRTSDEFIMLGGGGQAKREALAAAQIGKHVTIFQGFKGSADQLSASDLQATFVPRV